MGSGQKTRADATGILPPLRRILTSEPPITVHVQSAGAESRAVSKLVHVRHSKPSYILTPGASSLDFEHRN